MSDLNPFAALKAVSYSRQGLNPDVIHVTGWNDGIENQVCWVVVNKVESRAHERYYFQMNAAWINYIRTEHEWLSGIAYVETTVAFEQEWTLKERRLTPAQHAAIVARANGGAT